MLLASLEKCAALLADYEEHPGEEGIAYREAIAAIDEAEAAGITRLRPNSTSTPCSPNVGRSPHIWSVEDVQQLRPDLDDDQAWEVLQAVDQLTKTPNRHQLG